MGRPGNTGKKAGNLADFCERWGRRCRCCQGNSPSEATILSHDFVEAALMRRAGYSVWLVPELDGSYEQAPPHLLAYAQRDRRWCQGNLQHLRLVVAGGLHPVSRAHFLMEKIRK